MTEPMKLRARVAAPIESVRRALTDAAELRVWLAEHAEVDLPERFAFWGRYTPEGDAPHQRPLHVDETTLRFSWLLDGDDTTTEIRLEPEDTESTIVALSQTGFDYQDALAERGVRSVLMTFWALSLANLIDHLEGRELTPKVDFTSPDLRAQVMIDASPEQVFASLVDSEAASRWFGYPIEIEPYVGGRFAMGGIENNPNPAKIVELEPGSRLSVDWGEGFGVGTWELEDSEGRTRLTLVSSGFDSARPPYAAWCGTISGLAELRRYHELADWRPIWLQDATEAPQP
jgi:uncharacterized protein YndB with AHSA1/START domain